MMMKRKALQQGEQPFIFIERRSGKDRRQMRMAGIGRLFYNGRRQDLRRADDRRKLALMDQYSPRIFAIIVVILFLSLFDAVLTLVLISNGAVELNPVMAYFLSKGDMAFLITKYLLTALSVTIVVLINYVFIRLLRSHVRDLLVYFAGSFALVVVWELFLMVRYMR
jgi:type IV secretory pathway TrbL component